jgi:beta-galactosidase/beta-glucuronidase
LRRERWTSLDGLWDFALDRDAELGTPKEVTFDRAIRVPFSPETARSGVGEAGFFRACWYRRRFDVPDLSPGERLVLHFGAVDHRSTVWVEGIAVAEHEGGYTPFSADVTPLVGEKRSLEVVVRAVDDPHDLGQPRGKQDWQLAPHSIWYPRTSGIWQTVWYEVVSRTRIESVRWTPNLERWEIGVEAQVADPLPALTLSVRLAARGAVLAEDRYSVVAGEVARRIALSDPGIDDYRNELLWSPESPTLVHAELTLRDAGGRVLDRVLSYTALRAFAVDGDRCVLNGRPYPLRMVLDQGYWPDTGLTPPDGRALRKDVELTKALGFNGARKHQKIEDPRYLHFCDTLGLLVWEEMPSAYRFTSASIERLTCEWIAVIGRDVSHPCIVAWVPLNESWGVPNLPGSVTEQNYVRALYFLTKTVDPTRPVIGNDGWESVLTDIVGVHDYDPDPDRIRERYSAHDHLLPRLFERERPGGRALVIGRAPGRAEAPPLVLSEFGGIAFSPDPGSWGYSRCRTPAEFERAFTELVRTVRALSTLSGFCYTQLTDTYQEANGLLRADRTPKLPIERIRAAVSGTPAQGFESAARTERFEAPG